MTSTFFSDFQINNAEQFVESVSELASNSKLYLTYGKTDAWANDASPNVSNSSVGTVYELWNNMIGGKRLLGGDIRHVIKRHNWSSNTVYFAYDHRTPDPLNSNNIFYVMNSDYSVYKCLANNYGAVSTSEPTATNPESTTITADGYKWKYMYTLSDVEKLRFLSDNYIPVRTLMENDGSQQWSVQRLAAPGSIDNIIVVSGGTLYNNANSISVSISGDGSSATATASINAISNVITSIVITEPGSGYTRANVIITDAGTGSGASAVAIIGPPGGHGSNPLYELGGRNVVVVPRLRYDENSTLPTTNDFRQIAIIKDPSISQTSNAISALAFLQAYTVTCDGTGDFLEDEIVYQGTSLSAATFKGRVVSWSAALSKVYLINTSGTPTTSQSIIGATSFTTRVITSSVSGAAQPYTGKILYMDNISPVTRSSDQIEEFKVLLKF